MVQPLEDWGAFSRRNIAPWGTQDGGAILDGQGLDAVQLLQQGVLPGVGILELAPRLHPLAQVHRSAVLGACRMGAGLRQQILRGHGGIGFPGTAALVQRQLAIGLMAVIAKRLVAGADAQPHAVACCGLIGQVHPQAALPGTCGEGAPARQHGQGALLAIDQPQALRSRGRLGPLGQCHTGIVVLKFADHECTDGHA